MNSASDEKMLRKNEENFVVESAQSQQPPANSQPFICVWFLFGYPKDPVAFGPKRGPKLWRNIFAMLPPNATSGAKWPVKGQPAFLDDVLAQRVNPSLSRRWMDAMRTDAGRWQKRDARKSGSQTIQYVNSMLQYVNRCFSLSFMNKICVSLFFSRIFLRHARTSSFSRALGERNDGSCRWRRMVMEAHGV